MDERWKKRAGLRPTVVIIVILGLILLVGTGLAWRPLTAAFEWGRDKDNHAITELGAAVLQAIVATVLVWITVWEVRATLRQAKEAQDSTERHAREAVRVARRQSQVEIDAARASIRVTTSPIIVFSGVSIAPGSANEFDLTVENIGAGPALHVSLSLVHRLGPLFVADPFGSFSLGAGKERIVKVRLGPEGEPYDPGEARSADSSGRQPVCRLEATYYPLVGTELGAGIDVYRTRDLEYRLTDEAVRLFAL